MLAIAGGMGEGEHRAADAGIFDMKIAKLCDLLSVIADVVRIRSVTSADSLDSIVEALKPFAKRYVADLQALRMEERLADETAGVELIASVVNEIDLLAPLMKQVAAPQPKRAFTLFQLLLTQHSQMSVNAFIRSVSDTLVPHAPQPKSDQSLASAYIAALHDAQHDDEHFPLLYGALIADPRLSKDAIVDIASGFAYQMAKSTSKKIALERIWKVHDASQAYADKAKAMKGRSAG